MNRVPIRRWLRVRSFTIIELLVVIFVIALLVAILLPALARARESARAAACLSNERQINIAMNAYANDFRDYVAREGTAGTTPQTRRDRIPWPVAYRPYLDALVSSNPDPDDLFARAPYYRCPARGLSDQPVHYVDNGFAFFPDGTVDQRGDGTGNENFRRGPMTLDVLPYSDRMLYMAEVAADGDGSLLKGWKTFGVTDIDLGQCYDVWLPRHITPGLRPDDYRLGPDIHGKGANAMYLDGHGKLLAKETLTNLETWKDGVISRK
jgi:prepilin-type processing-associated H-X9-DG protein